MQQRFRRGARRCPRHGGSERLLATVPGGSNAGGTGDETTGYGDLCDAKQQTNDALMDAAGDTSDAIDEAYVDAVRAAYVAYYDAYQADVDAMVELSRAISDDPTVPEEVVAGAEEAIEAGGELFDETVAQARGAESAVRRQHRGNRRRVQRLQQRPAGDASRLHPPAAPAGDRALGHGTEHGLQQQLAREPGALVPGT